MTAGNGTLCVSSCVLVHHVKNLYTVNANVDASKGFNHETW